MKQMIRHAAYGLFPLIAVFNSNIVYGDQPQVVAHKSEYMATSGVASEGFTPKGDNSVYSYLTIPESFAKDLEQNKSSIAIKFNGCNEDPEVTGKPVLNLNGVIDRGAAPAFNKDWEAPSPRWRACPTEDFIVLEPGQGAEIETYVDILRCSGEGILPTLMADIHVLDSQMMEETSRDPREIARRLVGKPADSQFIMESHYRVFANCKWRAGDYKQIFGEPLKGRISGKALSKFTKKTPVNVQSYLLDKATPKHLKDDGGRLFKQTLEAVYSLGSGKGVDEQSCYPENNKDTASAQRSIDAAAGGTVTLSGMFSTKWTADHSLHPAWGFMVEAWSNDNGGWSKLGWSWVQSNSRWSINIPMSDTVRVIYRSDNSYYKPQGENGGTYRWAHSFNNVNSDTNIGHYYANTDGGAYNGLGELVESAMTLWSRLYWSAGVNPVMSSAVPIWFPNTWYDCGSGSGNPWSCASSGTGEVWLIASHGVQASVVVHELAHQLNNKFWQNKRPAGSGGSHSLNSCYPARLGMALREGFANFLPAWTGYPTRNVADGGFSSSRWSLGYDPERNTSPPNCTNGWENEVWVARTFWDLHDTRADNDDVLWFVHMGGVMTLYLGNGIASNGDARDMRDYENIYRGAASAGHQGFISSIFNQNRM